MCHVVKEMAEGTQDGFVSKRRFLSRARSLGGSAAAAAEVLGDLATPTAEASPTVNPQDKKNVKSGDDVDGDSNSDVESSSS